MQELILASTSAYRRQLMQRLGLPFTAEAPRCDEEQLKSKHADPRACAEFLAHAKAQSVATAFPEAAVIGSDQMVVFRGAILGKPGTPERAKTQLRALAGGKHELYTALTVIFGGRTWRHLDVTTLTMRPLTELQITRYVAADNPIDCAGSYKIENRGIALFDEIISDDHSAIMGLPMLALTRILAEIGFDFP